MSSPPTTIPLQLDAQYDEMMPGPQVEEGEMCCGNRDGVDDRAESLESMSSTSPLKADVCLGHSIQLPVELWVTVIDYLADEWVDVFLFDQTYESRLRELGKVCRGWHARCLFRTWERLVVEKPIEKEEAYRLINTLNQNPERCYTIKTVSFKFQKKSMSIFGMFAICMARKLPRTERLAFWRCDWDTGQLHAQVFIHITLAFESVTVLELKYVRFPSAVVFGRLMRALPRLSSLKCWDVSFDKHSDAAGRIWELHPLRLDDAELWDSDDVANFLVLIGAQLRHLSWRSLSSDMCLKLLAVTAESLSSIHLELAYFTARKRFPPNFVIDLTLAVNLRVLSIVSNLDDFDRVARILCRAFLPKMTELTIVSIHHYTGTFHLSIIQDKLDAVDKDSYAFLDQAFSSRQYPTLKKVTFNLRCEIWRSELMGTISEVSWGSHLSSRLPALHTSGRLVPYVSVRMEEHT
ncbi:uncharacterized protein FIBRA_03113 [Fibroporia radiculosa]|uniref:F-box domain-containing protein n=1 Tax=Fibroporia radiculosa TaxID=599839 RepID=J4GNA8_9APHY|nr:uncharacterized protein FIBRA_03113 [Fibroporia radiculosa]CCM01065.1 predicted protein [Fibroporia radiculosa]